MKKLTIEYRQCTSIYKLDAMNIKILKEFIIIIELGYTSYQ